MVEVFPVALADRDPGAEILLQREGSARSAVLGTGQHGEETEAIFPRVLGQGDTQQGGAGREQVALRDGRRRDTRAHLGGPARDERYAMATFPGVTLHAAPRRRRVMVMVRPHVRDRRGLGAVVAAEEDQRVIGDAQLLEGRQQLADDMVQFGDEVAVRAGLGRALETRGGEGGQVRGLRRMVQEERLVGRSLHLRLQPRPAPLQEDQVDLFVIEAWGDQSAAAIVRVRVPRQLRGVERGRRRDRHAIVLDVGVEPVRRRAAGGAEEMVETPVDGPVGDRLREIDHADARQFPLRARDVGGRLRLVDRRAGGGLEREADVPLAHGGGGVALASQHLGQGQPTRLDQARSADSREDAAAVAGTETHPSREEAITRGRADRRGGVRVREAETFPGQSVEVRRGDLRSRVVAADIAVAQVIGQDHDDVGPTRGGRGGQRRGQQASGEAQESAAHFATIQMLR